jgi:hypothetical protein
MNKQSLVSASIFLGVLGTSSAASAQEFSVKGNNTGANDVLQSTNTGTNTQDRIGVHGLSMPQPFWGYGGKFEGGFIGVHGSAYMSGTGSRYGGFFTASGGTSGNYAVYGFASTAAGSYAGYFSGNVFVSGTLTQASDLRLKTGLQDMQSGALGQVLRLKPKTFRS